MKKIILFLASALAMSCTNDQTQSIKLSVDQTIQIPVEYVSISAGISETGSEVTTVEKKGYEKLSEVVDLLKSLGFDNDQLEINSGEVTDFRYGDEPYEYNSSVKLDLKELDKIDTFRRSLTNAGVTSFRIASFNNSKEDSIYDTAYQDAINKAKRKANDLLVNQTVEVGNILNLHENVQEVIEVEASAQLVEPPPIKEGNITHFESVDPLFNKKFYTRIIEFTIEFALVKK